MARTSDNFFGRASRRITPQGLDTTRLLKPTTVINSAPGGIERSFRSRASGDQSSGSPLRAELVPHTIHFGSPSNQKSATSQSGSGWSNLLKHTTSTGIGNELGTGFATIGGLVSLVSGVASLFGGGSSKPTPPPLVKFELPNSQQQTAYLGSGGSTAYQGIVTETSAGTATPSGGIYAATTHSQTSSSQPLRYQSAEIAQAVKNALLTSSSLSDVIAEI